MRLILVRHGQTDSNVHHLLDTAHPGAPLNSTGLRQADALVPQLAGHPVTAVFASDLTRAMQTAQPVATAHGVAVTPHPGLREIQAGEDEMVSDLRRYLRVVGGWLTGDVHGMVPGGDAMADFLARFDDAVAGIAEAGHDCAVVVSHGAAIRVWTGLRARNATSQFVTHARLDNTYVVVLEGDPAAGWDVVTWGGEPPVAHLDSSDWLPPAADGTGIPPAELAESGSTPPR